MSLRKVHESYLSIQGGVDLNRARRAALRELESIPKNKRRARWHHLRGLCLYDLGDPEAELEFLAVLQFKTKHQYARLFLGHCCFDQSRYPEALDWLNSCRKGYFKRRGQAWRIIKNSELKLCCRFRISRKEPSLRSFDKFRRAYAKVDPVLAPVPAEIVACIEELAIAHRIPAEKLVPWVLQVEGLVANCKGLPGFVRASLRRLRTLASRLNL